MMTPQDANACTLYGCGIPVGEDTYLCAAHIVELDDLLAQVPTLLILLHPTILAGMGKRPGTGGRQTPGSRPPISLHAIVLALNIRGLPQRAYTEATTNPQAGHTLSRARDWIGQARQLTLPPPDDPTADPVDARERIDARVPPMPTRQLVPWMREHAAVKLTGQMIRHYAHRGWIARTNPGTNAHPTYRVTDILAAINRARKRESTEMPMV